ncbi:MAG: transcription antitermination factor NusB [Gammaproteobacteria bacterium]|nr:transcription antitermination factor NusB [Gammaproteobacteria bacterium]
MAPTKTESEKNPSAPKKKKPRASTKTPLAQRRKARTLVMQALYQWHISKAEPLEIEAQFHEENGGKIDWEYFSEVFLEIPKQQEALDQHIAPLLDRELKSLDPVERALLYLGTFELANRIDIPYRVVINECVELAKTFGATDSHKYINGVLDKLAKTLRSVELAAK